MKRNIFKKSNVICFILINTVIVIALIAYGLISKEQAAQRVAQRLREEISQKGILMEDYLQPEIALTKKLASSPTAIEFFENPSDDELRERAMREFQSFRDAFASHIIFWANDKDREFYNAMEYSYTINPDNPADYWYKMTLYDTDVYNFNINYNADLDMTCLWLNAVVRDKKMKPLGMSGTGIELDSFISKCYESLDDSITMYFFNETKEITGSKDKQALLDKLHIDSVYENIDFDKYIKKAKEVGGSGKLVEFASSSYESAVIRYLPSYDWFLIASAPDRSGRPKGVDPVLIIIIISVLIISSFIIIIAKFNDFINRIKKSQDLEKAIQIKERKIAERLFEEAQNLVVATKETAATSQDSSAAVKEIVATMEDSNVLSENISSKIKDVSSIANQTSSDVTEGVAQIEQNVAQLHEIFDANQQTIDGIKILSEKIESIWDIVTLINNVADQAKIIAFNAELEASTAGEAGKSFRIVANEIRRLSDGIIDGTREIKEKINEIQHSSDSLILASESGTEKINAGYENARGLEAKFANIRSSAEITANSADGIAEIIRQQASASEQILIALKEISAGVENFTVATDNISLASENVRKISEDLNNTNRDE